VGLCKKYFAAGGEILFTQPQRLFTQPLNTWKQKARFCDAKTGFLFPGIFI